MNRSLHRAYGATWRLLLLVALLSPGACAPRGRTLPEIYRDRPNVRQRDTSALVGRRILIDPGHGGYFAGSRGVDNTREADVNLGVGLYLWGLLRDAGADVHLTRGSDRDLLPQGSQTLRDDLAERVALLDSLQPEVFLSLHHNSNASLDRERNAVETYFKLEDEGPSYDLARAVHRSLAGSLGIEQATLRPGNYFVLRESSTASVLGEASYLSHPGVEARLQLAEKQLLEAEAYFLGLLDYFSRGIPQLTWAGVETDTLQSDQTIRVSVTGDSRSPIDPLSLEVLLNAHSISAFYDAASQTLQVPLQTLSPGRHRLEVQVRNLRGNAAAPLRKSFVVWSAPRSVRLHQEPQRMAPGSAGRVLVRVLAADGVSVGNGLAVAVQGQRCDARALETTTRDGSVIVRVTDIAPRAALRITAAGIDTLISLQVDSTAQPTRLVHIQQAPGTRALPDAWVQPLVGDPVRSDRVGLALLPGEADSLLVWCRGYIPRRVSGGDSITLQAVQGGAFLGTSIVLDPFGSGLEPTDPQWGISTQQVAFDLASRLATSLRAAGARVALTRGPVEDVPELERVRLAGRLEADFYVRIEATLEPASLPVVLHYPNSSVGSRLANGVGQWLLMRGVADSVTMDTDTQPILLQTPCPAIVVRLPIAPMDKAQHQFVGSDSLARQHVYALQVGLRVGLGGLSGGTLAGRALLSGDPRRVPEAVLLDRADLLDLQADGTFRFDGVASGRHELVFLHEGVRWEHWLTTEADSTTGLEILLQTPNP